MKNTQLKIKKLYEKNGWDTDPELLLIAMQEELGEVSARFLAENPKYKKSIGHLGSMSEEVGDLLSLLFAFCNKMGIDAKESVDRTITKRSKQG